MKIGELFRRRQPEAEAAVDAGTAVIGAPEVREAAKILQEQLRPQRGAGIAGG